MLWTCSDCTTAYSVGAARCPHCRSTNHTEDGMAKITAAGGPSDQNAGPADADSDVQDSKTPRKPRAKKDAPAADVTASGGLTIKKPGAGDGGE